MEGVVFQILKDGVGLKPPQSRQRIYYSLSWRQEFRKKKSAYVSAFKPFVLAKPSAAVPPPPDEFDQFGELANLQPFQVSGAGPPVDSVVYPSVIYSFGKRIIYFGLPESYASSKKAAKQALPSVPSSSSSATPTPQSTSARAKWKRVLRHFPLTKRPQTPRGPVSTAIYELFELTTTPKNGDSNSVSVTSVQPFVGRLTIQGVEAQKFREWCLVSGRMPGHGDNVDNGAYTIERNPSAQLDVLTFR